MSRKDDQTAINVNMSPAISLSFDCFHISHGIPNPHLDDSFEGISALFVGTVSEVQKSEILASASYNF